MSHPASSMAAPRLRLVDEQRETPLISTTVYVSGYATGYGTLSCFDAQALPTAPTEFSDCWYVEGN